MSKTDRYITAHIARGYFLVLTILVILFSVLELLNQLDDTGEGLYKWHDALYFVGLTAPARAIELLPVTALLGTLMGLGWLATRGELVALQALGISPLRIGWLAIKLGFAAVLIAALLTESVIPSLQQSAQTRRSLALSGEAALRTENGFWARAGLRFINVRSFLHGNVPADIAIYEFDPQGQLETFIHAHRADVLNHGEWLLSNVRRITFSGHETTARHFPELSWQSFLKAPQLEALLLTPDSLAPSSLYRYVRDLRKRGQNAKRYALALARKLTMPLTTALLILIALPFVFGLLRHASMGARIAAGSGVGVVFHLVERLTGHLGLSNELPPFLIAVLPSLLMGGIVAGLLWRSRFPPKGPAKVVNFTNPLNPV